MLVELSIRNFRCFREHVIPFRKNTVMVGQNNAGKSTVIEALRLVALAQSRYQVLRYEAPPEWLDEFPVPSAGIRPSAERLDLAPEGMFHQYGKPPAVLTGRFRNGTQIEVYLGPEFDLYAVVYGPGGRPVFRRADAARLHIPTISILPPLGPLANSERVLTPETVRRGLVTDLASSHFRNEVALWEDDHFADFKRFAEETWPRLEILEFRNPRRSPESELSLLVRDETFAAEVAWMGSGLKMWLQIMWFLARSKVAKTIILDEPDIFMHPDLQHRLIKLLGSLGSQIILTTHSVELLSEIDPEDVLVIDKKRSRSDFATNLGAVQRVMNRLGTAHNLHLSRLWTSRRFLLVEGKDMKLLSVFQKVLIPDSHLPIGTLPNMSIGGWGGWSQAIGSSLAMKNAAGEDILTYCILDRDYHTEDEIGARYAQAAENGINLHVWSRKEIENFLLVPELLRRTIAEEIPEGLDPPSTDLLLSKIEELVDPMKDRILDQLATLLLAQDKAGGVQKAYKLARSQLLPRWNSLDARLEMVPAKELISALSAWSQDQGYPSLSIPRILRNIRAEELSPEVFGLLAAIERGVKIPAIDT